MRSTAGAERTDRLRGLERRRAHRVHRRTGARRPRCWPASAISRARAAAATVPAACAAPERAASATSSPTTRAASTARTWTSPPAATSPTATAISPTARPASLEVAASSLDARLSVAGRGGDLADHRAQALAHRAERVPEHVTLRARLDVAAEVAAGDRLRQRAPSRAGIPSSRRTRPPCGRSRPRRGRAPARRGRPRRSLGGLGHLAHGAADAAGDQRSTAADDQQGEQRRSGSGSCAGG